MWFLLIDFTLKFNLSDTGLVTAMRNLIGCMYIVDVALCLSKSIAKLWYPRAVSILLALVRVPCYPLFDPRFGLNFDGTPVLQCKTLKEFG